MSWTIDGTATGVESVRLTPKTLTLSLDVARADLDTWREYDRAGDVQVRVANGGTFTAVDRANRSSPITVDPPPDMQPPLTTSEFYPLSFEEQQTSPDRATVTLTLQRTSERLDVYSPVSQSGGDWELVLDKGGTLALDDSQVGQQTKSGTTTGAETTIRLALDSDQAATLIDAAGLPDAVIQRPIPDGRNERVDTNGRQTMSLIAPGGAHKYSQLASSEYLIRNWTLSKRSFNTDREWQIELIAFGSGRQAPGDGAFGESAFGHY